MTEVNHSKQRTALERGEEERAGRDEWVETGVRDDLGQE